MRRAESGSEGQLPRRTDGLLPRLTDHVRTLSSRVVPSRKVWVRQRDAGLPSASRADGATTALSPVLSPGTDAGRSVVSYPHVVRDPRDTVSLNGAATSVTRSPRDVSGRVHREPASPAAAGLRQTGREARNLASPAESTGGGGLTQIASELDLATSPSLFNTIFTNLWRQSTEEAAANGTAAAGRGFLDILGEPFGKGTNGYNTLGSVGQLAMALHLSPNPDVAAIAEEGGPQMISKLRDRQALSGMKILDLGCGQLPSFALAAKALGAEVYTADGRDLAPSIRAQLDGHTVVNLNDPRATRLLLRETGGNFDLVTDNITGPVPGDPRAIFYPGPDAIRRVGEPLVAPGRWYYADAYVYQKGNLATTDHAAGANGQAVQLEDRPIHASELTVFTGEQNESPIPFFQPANVNGSEFPRDRHGNFVIERSRATGNSHREKEAFLVSRDGEGLVRDHPEIFDTIDHGMRLLAEQGEEVDLGNGIKMSKLTRNGGQSLVYFLDVGTEKYVIRTHAPKSPHDSDHSQPFSNEMQQYHAVAVDLRQDLADTGLETPVFIFASERLSLTRHEAGDYPTREYKLQKVRRFYPALWSYIKNQMSDLWDGVQIDTMEQNFIQKSNGNLVYVDAFARPHPVRRR